MLVLSFFLFVYTCSFYVRGYNEDMAMRYVNLCQATYCVTDINKWTCKTCDPTMYLEYIVEHSGSKALQGYDSYTNTLFTSFRGSSNIQNWLENVQFNKISPYSNSSIKVESGFYKAYNYIKDDIFDNLIILSDKYETSNVIITGHSSGGAMATLMSYDLATEYKFLDFRIQIAFTFGSPRVGNSEFSKSFHLNVPSSYRVTHYYDMVPHVPQEFVSYEHVPSEIWYNENNSKYTLCHDFNSIEDPDCSNSCSPVHCTSTDDHLYYLNVTMGNDDGTQCW